MADSTFKAAVILIGGVVQGVGFRPFVYNLARSNGIRGFVRNTDLGVVIEAEGDNLERFIQQIQSNPPPMSDIQSVQITALEYLKGYSDFKILVSLNQGGFTLISPDVSICDDCMKELMDKRNRRYLYPFINCTNCGPRYTITRKVPYDRPNTTMDVFSMCPDCNREYNDPNDRRFHAQPNACPDCGPKLQFISIGSDFNHADPLLAAIEYLSQGKIIALKGLGGFHLACDGYNESSVARLRKMKRKSDKPFALMAADLAEVERNCILDEKERELLLSPRRPVVLLKKRAESSLPGVISPGNDSFGFMLPYTPLHYLLFHLPSVANKLQSLIMTSGNLAEEPIVTGNNEAVEKLSFMVDGFLMHDREIFMRTDDSVLSSVSVYDMNERSFFIRRARGYVPDAIPLKNDGIDVMGAGADMKNTFTLLKGKYAIVSQHIGDMENHETLRFYEQTLHNLRSVYRVEPAAIGFDMHPGYLSSDWARRQSDMKLIPVQHHHAHMASIMAIHGLVEEVIGVVFDGTGYGLDGRIWGGEFLTGNALNFRRMGHFRYIPLIGGESSVRLPWKTAVSFIRQATGKDCMDILVRLGFVQRYGEKKIFDLLSLFESEEFSPLSSGAGRVFDAIAAILGICDTNTFEGEAPMKLEAAIRSEVKGYYEPSIDFGDNFQVDFSPIMLAITDEFLSGVDKGIISSLFHNSVLSIITEGVCRISGKTGLKKVILAGGAFQNRFLLSNSVRNLRRLGFEVFTNELVPYNDASISLGQAYIVRNRMGL